MAFIDGPASVLSDAMIVHQYTLTMAKEGNGIVAPDVGEYPYLENRPAILAAMPDTGWIFDGWDGDDVEDQNAPLTMIIMDDDKSVTGMFKEAVTLTIIATGGGATTPPSGVITPYIKGTTATIKAAAIAGYEFTEWTGDLVSTKDVDTILMDANKTIGCIFRPKADPASIYSKLYYGTDSKKAYWNVDNQWTFFATIRHGLLEGLGDDSHLQYHTDIRGDARYYKKSEVDALVASSGAITGLLDETAHDLLDHAGLTGIPSITGLLDETAHDLLDHAGLTGIPSVTGLLDETAHDLLDHTGITGCGGTGGGAFTDLTDAIASYVGLGGKLIGIKSDTTGLEAVDAPSLSLPLTTQGDILIQGASSPARLGIGIAGQILTVNAGATAPEWKTVGASPLTTKGDLFVYGSADARLPVGTNGQVLTADAAQTLGVKWAAASGGTAYEYPIDEPPGSANAMDDEFGGSSVDAKWTILNQTTGQTYTVADGLLKIYNPYTITGRRIFALTQPCPAGAWKVRAKFEWDVPARKYYGLGLIIRRTTGNDRSKVFIPAVHDELRKRICCGNVSDLTSWGTEYLGYYLNNTRYYLEAEYDETNIILRISYNGRAFLTILSEAASSFLGGAPEQVGINLQPWPEKTSSDAFSFNGSCHWFRRIS